MEAVRAILPGTEPRPRLRATRFTSFHDIVSSVCERDRNQDLGQRHRFLALAQFWEWCRSLMTLLWTRFHTLD